MNNRTIVTRILRFLKLIYFKIFRINDTPQKVALGLGLGVFFGILPGLGPIAALFFALLFRVNRASALIGSLFTNTWLSVITFLLSVKIGSKLMGLDWKEVYAACQGAIKDFHLVNLFKLTIAKALLPVIIGYLVISFCLAALFYLLALAVLNMRRRPNV